MARKYENVLTDNIRTNIKSLNEAITSFKETISTNTEEISNINIWKGNTPIVLAEKLGLLSNKYNELQEKLSNCENVLSKIDECQRLYGQVNIAQKEWNDLNSKDKEWFDLWGWIKETQLSAKQNEIDSLERQIVELENTIDGMGV